MDKYEERVLKISEKKKNHEIQKKKKRKTLMQCICIVLVSAVAIAAFVVLPKRASVVVKPENTASEFFSESNSEILPTETHSETTDLAETAEPTSDAFVPLPNDAGGDIGDYVDIYDLKYRSIYYTGGSSGLNVFFAELVSDEEYNEWLEQYYDKYSNGDGMFKEGEEINEPERMKVVDFIMYFDIPKEEFEEANNTWCHRMIKWGDVPVMNPKDYKEQEEFEVYNVDILYTFDDEIINAYYERGEYPFDTEEEYLEAIENDGYITQTKDFIMLDGFEKVTLPALPSDAEPVYIDFDWRSKRCK